MFKLGLEKAEEPIIKLPASVGSLKKQKNSRKTSALLTMPKPFIVWITTNSGKFWKRWEYQTTFPASWEIWEIMWNAGLDEAQTGIKISGRNINNLRSADDTTLLAESEEELKSPLMKVKEESEKLA